MADNIGVCRVLSAKFSGQLSPHGVFDRFHEYLLLH
jgi:hypothetical protein